MMMVIMIMVMVMGKMMVIFHVHYRCNNDVPVMPDPDVPTSAAPGPTPCPGLFFVFLFLCFSVFKDFRHNHFWRVNNYFPECTKCYNCGYRKKDNGEAEGLPELPFCNGEFTENFWTTETLQIIDLRYDQQSCEYQILQIPMRMWSPVERRIAVECSRNILSRKTSLLFG